MTNPMKIRALQRCRTMTFTTAPDGRTKIEVHDPVINRVVTTYYARTEQDVARVKRAYAHQYRIPNENVTDTRKKQAPKGAATEPVVEHVEGTQP